MAQQRPSFDETSDDRFYDLSKPSSYNGLYGFHKYWGKKPVEPLRFLISELTSPGQLVADPFVGSGAVAREAVQSGRRFIGGDLNPLAVRLTRFFLTPCDPETFTQALNHVAQAVRGSIDGTYRSKDHEAPSHFLWEDQRLVSVWQKAGRGRKKIESGPGNDDVRAARDWDDYLPTLLRPLKLFDNSRINTTSRIDWRTLFTGRALRNIELLLHEIRTFENPLRTALELTLTSSAGQMSKMVFAITGRGKTTGQASGRTEVGSWIVGYWRPRLHFEINVWNCFESKAGKLLGALRSLDATRGRLSTLEDVVAEKAAAAVDIVGALELLQQLPDNSVQLLLTDPPHGDRIAYLELSDMWNALLDQQSLYEKEIVVSNARQRGKTIEVYLAALDQIFRLAAQKLRAGGFLAVMFNSRRQVDWRSCHTIDRQSGLAFVGAFPLTYSAASVAQDNRPGGLRTDYILLFRKGTNTSVPLNLRFVPGWCTKLPYC